MTAAVGLTLRAYLSGCVGVGVAVGMLGYGAWRLRAALLPHWTAAAARLAEAIVALAALVLSAQLLGSVGWFHAAAVLAAAVVAGAATTTAGVVAGRRRTPADQPSAAGATSDAPDAPAAPAPERRGELIAAGIAVSALAAQWFAHTLKALAHGMTEPDTLWYHGPFAARFVQEQSFTGLDHLGPEVARYYPFNAELVHAVTILPFGRDLLSPLVNLGWAALALVAAWCVGRRAGVGALSVIAATVVLTLPVVAGGQPGQASNDIPSAALLIAAVALLLHEPLAPVPTALAAVAAGLALGSKLTAAGIVAALTIGVVVVALRGHRPRTAAVWCAGVAIAGGYWFVRNWVVVDNPLPWYRFELGPLSFPLTHAESGSALIDRATQWDQWRALYLPGLHQGLGVAWPAVVGLTITAIVALAARRGRPLERLVALVVLVGVVTYAATPFTGSVGFALNLRYLAPTLLTGLATLPRALAATETRARGIAATGGVALVAVNLALSPDDLVRAWPRGFVVHGAVGALAAAAGVAVVARALRSRAVPGAAVAGLVVVLLVGAGWPLAQRFFDGRYVAAGLQHDAVNAFFRDVEDAQVAVFGTATYPMFGLDLSNRAALLEAPMDGPASERCRRTLSLLGDRYSLIVLLPTDGGFLLPMQPDEAWLASDPAVTQILRDGDDVVFRVSGALDRDRCQAFGEG